MQLFYFRYDLHILFSKKFFFHTNYLIGISQNVSTINDLVIYTQINLTPLKFIHHNQRHVFFVIIFVCCCACCGFNRLTWYYKKVFTGWMGYWKLQSFRFDYEKKCICFLAFYKSVHNSAHSHTHTCAISHFILITLHTDIIIYNWCFIFAFIAKTIIT